MISSSLFILAGIGLLVCLALAITQGAFLVRMRRELNVQDKLLKDLRNDVAAMLLCARGIGERIQKHQKHLGNIARRQAELEFRGPDESQFRHAKILIQKGATIEELVKTCGISKGEAELLAHMRKLQSRSLQSAQSA